VPFAALDAPDYDILHLLLDDLPFLLAQPFSELVHIPHRFLGDMLFGVLLDGVVGQMGKSVVDIVE
jgi:hypothetical protein